MMAERENLTRLAATLVSRYGDSAEWRAAVLAHQAAVHGSQANEMAWQEVAGAARALQAVGTRDVRFLRARAHRQG